GLIGGPVVYIPKRPGEPDVSWADVAKIRRDLDWTPLIPFEEGVGRMMAEIQNWRDAALLDPASVRKATRARFAACGREQATCFSRLAATIGGRSRRSTSFAT